MTKLLCAILCIAIQQAMCRPLTWRERRGCGR